MAKSFRCQSWCQFGRAESMKVRIGDEKWKETPLRHCGLHNVMSHITTPHRCGSLDDVLRDFRVQWEPSRFPNFS
jgi:hypothetical protein